MQLFALILIPEIQCSPESEDAVTISSETLKEAWLGTSSWFWVFSKHAVLNFEIGLISGNSLLNDLIHHTRK